MIQFSSIRLGGVEIRINRVDKTHHWKKSEVNIIKYITSEKGKK